MCGRSENLMQQISLTNYDFRRADSTCRDLGTNHLARLRKYMNLTKDKTDHVKALNLTITENVRKLVFDMLMLLI